MCRRKSGIIPTTAPDTVAASITSKVAAASAGGRKLSMLSSMDGSFVTQQYGLLVPLTLPVGHLHPYNAVSPHETSSLSAMSLIIFSTGFDPMDCPLM